MTEPNDETAQVGMTDEGTSAVQWAVAGGGLQDDAGDMTKPTTMRQALARLGRQSGCSVAEVTRAVGKVGGLEAVAEIANQGETLFHYLDVTGTDLLRYLEAVGVDLTDLQAELRGKNAASAVQRELESLAEAAERIQARLLVLRGWLPDETKFPQEMLEGRATPTLELYLHGLLGIVATDEVAPVVESLQTAASLTPEVFRQDWEAADMDDPPVWKMPHFDGLDKRDRERALRAALIVRSGIVKVQAADSVDDILARARAA